MTRERIVEKIKRASEVMVPLDQYPHVNQNSTIRQAIEEMYRHELEVAGRKSLPRVILVFDDRNQLVGMVRRRDIMRGLEPKFLVSKPLEYRKKLFDVKVDPNLSEISYDKMIKGIREQAGRPVSDVMRPIKVTVNHEEHLVRVIYEMVDNNLSLLPVLKDKKVVGVLRSVDMLHEVAQLLF
jgi:predicted transcriptional regulator